MKVTIKLNSLTVSFIILLILSGCREQKQKIEYYANGNKKYEVPITSDGIMHGEMSEYFASGELKSEMIWTYGTMSGDYIEYYKNGKVKKRGTYLGNVPLDIFKYFYPDGNIEHIEVYQEGMVVDFMYYDEEGNLKKEYYNIVFSPKYDTVSQGGKYIIDMRVFNKVYDSLAVIVGKLDKNGFITDTTQILKLEEGIYSYNLNTSKLGWNYFGGIAYNFASEVNQKDTSKILGISFKYEYFVEP